jgi:DNA-binding MarR family transcriptional regulator
MGPRTGWLEEDEARAWLPLMTVVEWLNPALDEQLQRDVGISNYEYGLMAQLSGCEHHTARMSDLARSANSTLPRLSKAVRRLEDRGWVVRRPDPQDARTTLAQLTPNGWVTVQEAAPGHVARVRELVFDHLTPREVEQLGRIATKLAAAVGPEGASAGRFG